MDIRSLIRQRRVQLGTHSVIYYVHMSSIVTDSTFDRWAKELVELQKKYPKESKEVEYYEEFKDWDGTTGYHLTSCRDFQDKAQWLVGLHNRLTTE